MRYIERLELLADRAVTEGWSMKYLAGLLSKPKRIITDANHPHMEIPEKNQQRDQND